MWPRFRMEAGFFLAPNGVLCCSLQNCMIE